MGDQNNGDTILHQGAVEDIIRKVISESSDGRIREIGPFPFTFDTPDLLAGAVLGQLTEGDTILDGRVMVDEVWDGTTPSFTFLPEQFAVYGIDMTRGSVVNGSFRSQTGQQTGVLLSTTPVLFSHWAALSQNNWPYEITEDTDIVVKVDNNGGGDPGSTQGAARLYLTISTPIVP